MLCLANHTIKMTRFPNVFVTVGTTEFDQLIKGLFTDNVLSALQQIGCTKLTIQIGNGGDIAEMTVDRTKQKYGIDCEYYRLKPTISDDIRKSNLVISHAGAGSCTEILSAKKPLLVVINEDLMDNHQTELAEQLYNDGYLLYCTPKTLSDTLKNQSSALANLREYESGNVQAFVKHLDDLMGF